MNPDQVRRIIIKSLFSDDVLMDMLVLKGGNALAILHGIQERASMDLDFSIEEDFSDLDEIKKKFVKVLEEGFSENGYVVFDFEMTPRPKKIGDKVQEFWGGYKITFKLMKKTDKNMDLIKTNIALARRTADVTREDNHRKFEIDISKFEYVEEKEEIPFEGMLIYVYSLRLIVFEKLRAICQQLPQYKEVVESMAPKSNRYKDFFDIYNILEANKDLKSKLNDANNPEIKRMIKAVFEAKRVPVSFIKLIEENRDIFYPGYDLIIDTISGSEIEERDFYINYVIDYFAPLIDLEDNNNATL